LVKLKNPPNEAGFLAYTCIIYVTHYQRSKSLLERLTEKNTQKM